jgi:hypothetical protein
MAFYVFSSIYYAYYMLKHKTHVIRAFHGQGCIFVRRDADCAIELRHAGVWVGDPFNGSNTPKSSKGLVCVIPLTDVGGIMHPRHLLQNRQVRRDVILIIVL